MAWDGTITSLTLDSEIDAQASRVKKDFSLHFTRLLTKHFVDFTKTTLCNHMLSAALDLTVQHIK